MMALDLLDERYQLDDVLGSGAMGIVRAASDRRLDRRVAIKLLADNLALDAVARERFEREARLAARVTHPNVVTVHDVGVATLPDGQERPYIVMELLEGGSLRDHLVHQGVLTPREVAAIARQALMGLRAAHEVGLLHRDLKPANLLRGDAGSVKLTDFGIAYAGEQPGLTRTGYVLGSLAYLAPERLRGEPATACTDLYGLAATLVELLLGRPRERDEPLQLPAGTPSGLRRLIERSLAIEPPRRPQDADAALELLDGTDDGSAEATRELTAAIAPTVRVPTRDATPAAATPGDAPTEPRPATAFLPGGTGPDERITDEAGNGRAHPWWRRPALIAAGIVVAALLATLAYQGNGDAPADPPADPPAEGSPLVDEAEQLRDRVNDLIGR